VVVVVVVVVVVAVVEGVVPVQVSVVQTCWPTELQTQVLQSTELRVPGTQSPGWLVVEETELQSAGHVPSLPGTCSPSWVVAVLHQLTPSPAVVQAV